MGAYSQPNEKLDLPPGAAWMRVVGLSVITLPAFWLEPHAKRLEDTEDSPAAAAAAGNKPTVTITTEMDTRKRRIERQHVGRTLGRGLGGVALLSWDGGGGSNGGGRGGLRGNRRSRL